MLSRAILAGACLLAAAAAPAPAQAETDTASLEARLQKVEDELAIKRIIVEYAVRLDAKDFDGYVDLFAENGVWQTGQSVRHGRQEIKEMLTGMYGTPEIEPFGYERYRIVSNMQVDIHGDRATARSRHLSIMRGENGTPRPTLGGLYEDEYIRQDDGWKILRRVDYPIMPTAEEWADQLADLLAEEKQ